MSQGKRGELSSPPDDNRYHPYRSSNPVAKKPYRGQPSFPVGASNSGPSACALCLGRFRHPIHKCASEFLWDKRTKTRCHRNAEGHLVNPEGFEICYNWQRPKGCSNTTRSHVHKCSKDAGQRIMELRAALKARASKARTPYQPEVWSRFLSAAGLIHKYAHIPNGFRFGFMGSVPTIHHTYSPPNSPSLLTQHDTFATILDREYSTGCYIGPLSKTETETLIGPFQTAPLAMVPKPGKPGKFRLVQNLSFPLHPSATSISSINSAIDFDLYPCTWGSTASTICLLIWSLPPGSQAAVRDMAEAYRTIPLHPSQWPGLVVRTGEDSFAIDCSFGFSFSVSAGTYCGIADAGADIF